MPRKSKQTPVDPPRPAGPHGSRTKLEIVLKWAGGTTAILSLIFGLNQLTQLVSDVRERQRQATEHYNVGKLQHGAADYVGAWNSFEQGLKASGAGGKLVKLTGQLGKETIMLREAQEDLAMEWLENITTSEGQSFTDIVDRLFPVLSRGLASSSGARKADLLAHTGWANFLRWRDGKRHLNPEPQYREALEIDPANPYAHAHWGHWILWMGEAPEGARQHFSAALTSGRVRDYVRRIQLSAWKNEGEDGHPEFLAAVNDMRKNHESIDSQTISYLRAIYYLSCPRYDSTRFTRLIAAVPATEQLATFRALLSDWDSPSRDACLASLMQAAGQQEEASLRPAPQTH